MSFALYGKLRHRHSGSGGNLDTNLGTLDSRLRWNDDLHIRSRETYELGDPLATGVFYEDENSTHYQSPFYLTG